MTEPKRENMDGDSFSLWLWKLSEEIHAMAANLGTYQDGRDWAAAAFNVNSDPKAAACEWLHKRLDNAFK
jgi:hypothetical protein